MNLYVGIYHSTFNAGLPDRTAGFELMYCQWSFIVKDPKNSAPGINQYPFQFVGNDSE